MPGPWERYAATSPAPSGPWAKYGAPPPAPPEPPGFGERLAESFGIPTSREEMEAQARDAATHQLDAGAPGLAFARGYGNQLAQTWKEYKEQLSDIADRFTSKQIDKTEATKQLMNAAAIHGVKAIPIFGPTLFNYGQDIEQKNYPGAAGSALGFTAQVAGPKALESGIAAVPKVAGPVTRTAIKVANKALSPAAVGGAVASYGGPVGAAFGAGIMPELFPGWASAAEKGLIPTPEWAAKPTPQMSLFRNAPKVGNAPLSGKLSDLSGEAPLTVTNPALPQGELQPPADMSKYYGKTPTRSNLKANQRQLASPTASTAPVPKAPHPPEIMKILTTPGEVSDADMVKLQNYFTGHAATVAETVRHSLAKAGD